MRLPAAPLFTALLAGALAAPQASAIVVIGADQSPFWFVAPQTGSRFGTRVAAAPGFRDDGRTRLLAGAELWDTKAVDAGFAATYEPRTSTGESIWSEGDWLIQAQQTGERVGSSLAGGGDVNDDGIMDLAVGAWSRDLGGMFDVGSVYVRFGAAELPAVDETPGGADLVFEGESGTDHFGFAVVIDGDLNGDGVHDVVIGSPLGQGTEVSNGEVFIFFGGAHLTTGSVLSTADADVHFRGSQPNAGAGYALATGNINGDTYDDLVIGAPSATPLSGRVYGGAGYIFLGRSFASGASYVIETGRDVEILGAYGGDACGTSIALLDLDADDLEEILIGSPFASVGTDGSAGRMYLFAGAPIGAGVNIVVDTRTDAVRTINGDEAGDLLAWAIADAGDVNRDGEPDILIGAPGADPGQRDGAGAAYLWLSQPGVLPGSGRATNVMDRVYTGASTGDEMGAALAGIGDFNDDGGMDFAIGAPGYDVDGFESGGAVFVFTGVPAVAVSEPGAPAVRVLGPAVPNPTAGGTRIRLLAPLGQGLGMSIVDASGRLVRGLTRADIHGHTIEWDGRDQRGRTVGSGVYTLSVTGPDGRRQLERIVVAR